MALLLQPSWLSLSLEGGGFSEEGRRGHNPEHLWLVPIWSPAGLQWHRFSSASASFSLRLLAASARLSTRLSSSSSGAS